MTANHFGRFGHNFRYHVVHAVGIVSNGIVLGELGERFIGLVISRFQLGTALESSSAVFAFDDGRMSVSCRVHLAVQHVMSCLFLVSDSVDVCPMISLTTSMHSDVERVCVGVTANWYVVSQHVGAVVAMCE